MDPRTRLRPLVLLFILALGLASLPAAAIAEPASPTASVHYDGDLTLGTVLTAQLDGSTPPDGSTFRWFVDDAPAAAGSGPTYTVSTPDVEKALSVEISTPPTDIPAAVVRSAATPRVLRTAVPVVAGTPAVGRTLSVSLSGWSTGTTHEVEWFADGTEPVATGGRLTLTPDLVGHTLSAHVTGSLAGYGTVTEASEETLRVQSRATPSVSGTLLVGATLRADPGRWVTGTRHSYRWFASGRAIPRATGRTLRLTRGQGAKRIRVEVTGRLAGYPVVTSASRNSLRVMTAAATPRIKGSAAAGRTLRAVRGTWTRGVRVRYRWYADGKPLAGGTRSTLTVPSNALGKRISVRATGSRSGFATIAKNSRATQRVQRVGRAALSGRPLATHRMRVAPGRWTSGTRFTYRWALDGKAVAGATGSSITVKPSWKGKRLSATVRGSRPGFATFTSRTGSSSPITLPEQTGPISTWDCPSWAPIKGNADSGIYHVPGQRFYDRTQPEECFANEPAAVRAGYRRSKV